MSLLDFLGAEAIPTATAMLRREAPWQALQMTNLNLNVVWQADWQAAAGGWQPHAATFCAALVSHRLMKRLVLHAPLGPTATLGAVVGAALAIALPELQLTACSLSPASAPDLARLVVGGTLATFVVRDSPLLDAVSTPLLCAVIRSTTTLRVLFLENVALWEQPALASLLLGAVRQSPVESLGLDANRPDSDADRAAAGAALAALVAASPPALRFLTVSRCDLGDSGLGLLFDALPLNRPPVHSLPCPATPTASPPSACVTGWCPPSAPPTRCGLCSPAWARARTGSC